MAERRMFAKKITDDDRFAELSSSAQALYLHLSMAADDDGFCNQVSISMFRAHASVDDLESLLQRRYLYQFENGVIVISHWRMANALRKDRYTPTVFKNELSQLNLDENGMYTRGDGCQVVADWLPDGCQMVADCLPQDRLGKDRLGKDRLGEDKKEDIKTKRKRFIPPALDEIKDYLTEKNYTYTDAESFFNYYEANGWKTGRNKMADWKAAVRNWESREKQWHKEKPVKPSTAINWDEV